MSHRFAIPQQSENLELNLLKGFNAYNNIMRLGYKSVHYIILLPTQLGYAPSGPFNDSSPNTKVEVETVLKVAITTAN